MAKFPLRYTLILPLALGVSVSLSAIATFFVHRWEVSQRQTQFQQEIENLTIALQRSLNRYTDVLIFLDDYYRVRQGQIDRTEFEAFVARSLQVYPGIQALEWAPVVTQDDRPTYEAAMRADGFPDFQITELTEGDRLVPAGDRPSYIPVTYIAPLAGNEAALGFDLNSSGARVAAIEPARDTGKIHATGRIRLVQEQRDQYGFLVLLPRYQTAAMRDTGGDRQAQFSGMLLGVFRVADVVEEALQDLSYDVDFVLTDQSADPEEQLLGRYEAALQTVRAVEGDRPPQPHRRARTLCPTATACTRSLDLGQRQWQVAFSPAVSYPLGFPYGTWATLLTGLLLSGSLALFLHNLQRELVRTRTLNNLKQRFFSMASHELRTPLSTILLSTDSLQTHFDHLSDAQKKANLHRIYQTAQQMSQQITDLLTLTRSEVGKLEFSPQMLDVVAFCQQVVDELQGGIHQPIQFSHGCDGVKAFWDKVLVRSLLGNLISNAARYSPEDAPIDVTLSCDDQAVTLTVGDRGIGIPANDQAHIREAFRRGSNVGDIAGTGLGLAIVNACVEQHRGTWTIDSREGKGTRITARLPLE